MKKKSNKHFRLNKINVSKLNTRNAQAILGGNTANNCNDKTEVETCGNTCTTSRYTVDFSSQGGNC